MYLRLCKIRVMSVQVRARCTNPARIYVRTALRRRLFMLRRRSSDALRHTSPQHLKPAGAGSGYGGYKVRYVILFAYG